MGKFPSSILFIVFMSLSSMSLSQDKIVIAHRGASGYLPEHTLQAKVLAYAMGADYIEQDVVMSSDNELVVFHDLTLDRMTNVAELYPDRQRDDGQYYVIDFTLAELQSLDVLDNLSANPASQARIADFTAAYPEYFSSESPVYRIHTLAEELELISRFNTASGQDIGIYPEIKSPWFHRQEGKDLSSALLSTLKAYGYDSIDDKAYLQSFDFNEIRIIHDQIMPALGMELKLVQLIAENDSLETMEPGADGNLEPYDFNWMHTAEGLNLLAQYVAGIGPNIAMIISPESTADSIIATNLVALAHEAGLLVHPFTFRSDPARMPSFATDFEHMLHVFLISQNVDGIFTDHPDQAVSFLQKAE